MGRKTKIRASYVQDATYLNRLVDAIENDPKLDKETKSQLVTLLSEVVLLFAKVTAANRIKAIRQVAKGVSNG